MTIFTKGAKDGKDRDERILNAVIALDISGSMNTSMNFPNNQGNNQSRIALSKEAILMFYSKLRPNDSFGLITFTIDPTVILPV